jgi:hypothetical protein
MKIKYRLPDKRHDTCLFVGNLTTRQFKAVIEFLEYQGVYNYEYLGGGK